MHGQYVRQSTMRQVFENPESTQGLGSFRGSWMPAAWGRVMRAGV